MNSDKEQITALLVTLRRIASRYERAGIDDVDDIVQKAALRYLNTRFRKGPSYTWCQKVVRSVVVSAIREHGKHCWDLSLSEPGQAGLVSESGTEQIPEPAYSVEHADPDLMPAIETMFQELKPAERQSLALHVIGYEYHEIAEGLKIPKSTVRSRIHQGRKAARFILAEYR